jgi:hypothetical protein
MRNALRGFWRWSNRRGAGFDCSSACFGSMVLTILLSQQLWSGWLNMPHDSRVLQYALNFWPFCLALGLFVVCSIEATQITYRLLTTGHSGWWAARR